MSTQTNLLIEICARHLHTENIYTNKSLPISGEQLILLSALRHKLTHKTVRYNSLKTGCLNIGDDK